MRQSRRQTREATATNIPTIKDVAARAGVSPATVSRVAAGVGIVSEELIKRVREAMHTLNYQPNRQARNLRHGTNRVIGVIVPDIQNPFFTSVIRAIEEVLQAADYMLVLGNCDDHPEREQLYLDMLRAEGVAGIIFPPSNVQTQGYQQLLKMRIPLVTIDRPPRGLEVDAVRVDNTGGARTAVDHLIKLGHQRIGLILAPTHIKTADERKRGYEQALIAAGISIDQGLIRALDYQPSAEYAALEEHLGLSEPLAGRQAGGYAAMKSLLQLNPPPTAVFVTNNLMTLGALQAIHELGVRIPSDIAVVGFDDMPWATALQPPLTVVAQPTYEVGRTAAQLLLDRLHEPHRPIQKVVLKTKLIVRASCGAEKQNQR